MYGNLFRNGVLFLVSDYTSHRYTTSMNALSFYTHGLASASSLEFQFVGSNIRRFFDTCKNFNIFNICAGFKVLSVT